MGKMGKEAFKNRRKKKFTTTLREQTQCRFCREGKSYIDYKDIDSLQKLLTNRGKIFSRKRSGNCATCQRKVKLAIKRAHLADRQLLIIDQLPLVVPHLDLELTQGCRQLVTGVILTAHDALKVDRLARTIDGSVGVKVDGVGLDLITAVDAKVPWIDPES